MWINLIQIYLTHRSDLNRHNYFSKKELLYSLYNGLALLHKYTSTRTSDGVHQSARHNHVWYHLRSGWIVTTTVVWHDVGHSLCECVCGCPSENLFVCFGAKPTQRACARDRKKDEGRKVPEEHERAVKRRTQSAEGSSRDQSTEQDSRQRLKQSREDKSA